jgi:hypothetical protein
MNLKKAKTLRRIARLSKQPLIAYEPLKPVRIFAKEDVAHIGPSAIFLGQKKLAPCIRSIYHGLKKRADANTLPSLEVLRKAA